MLEDAVRSGYINEQMADRTIEKMAEVVDKAFIVREVRAKLNEEQKSAFDRFWKALTKKNLKEAGIAE